MIKAAAEGAAKGAIGKPLQKSLELIDKMVFCMPWMIKRLAKAEAEALLTRTEAVIEATKRQATAEGEIADIRARAALRVQRREVQRQRNVEAIAAAAMLYLPTIEPDEEVEADWVTYFFDLSADISNEEMQELWGKILGDEIAKPGRFSRRTLSLVRVLSVNEARAFNRLRSYVWFMDGRPYLIKGTARLAIEDEELMNLEHGGLIVHGGSSWPELEFSEHAARAVYFERQIELTFSERRSLPGGPLSLTSSGEELARIATGTFDQTYFEAMIEWWRKSKVGVEVLK
jgi:hypothetical protein